MPHSPYTIISLGGSLIVPDEIDTELLKGFVALIKQHVAGGMKFVIIAGGGKTARRYRDAAKAVQSDLTRDDADWIGIHATRLNGHLIRTIFRDEAYPHVVHDPTEAVPPDFPIVVAAGWKPGWSTDYVAVQIAKNVEARRMINLSNVDHVYTADPRKDPTAKPIEKSNWKDFRTLLPETWDPGLNTPFDPVAAKDAEKLGLEVAIINGKNLAELDHYLSNQPFVGTVIS